MKSSSRSEAQKTTPPREDDEVRGVELAPLSENGLGEVKIHDDVIISLTRNAVLEVEGVARLAGNPLVSTLADLVGSSRINSRAIAVSVGKGNQISLTVRVNLLAGYCIPEVAEKIQKQVINTVGSATGMDVRSVQILVQDIEAVHASADSEEQ